MSSKGFFITLEGNEGCGKSTQLRLLRDDLRRAGHNVLVTREPGGTRAGDAIRAVLLDRKQARMNATCETLLYMASRAQLAAEVIRPALKARRTVLCDRWVDATYAYQGFGGGVDRAWIRRLGLEATGGLEPDITLWLDLPLEAGLRRAAGRGPKDRVESKTLAYHRRVRRGYEDLARRQPRRFRRVRLNASDSIEAVRAKVREALPDVL